MYWGSSVWLSMEQINYWSDFLHLSGTEKKIEVQGDSTLAITDFKKAYDSVRREVLYP
jgi:hypothetical protein